MNRVHAKEWLVFVGLVALGTTARVALQYVPNFAPVAGLALFAGYFFTNRWLALGVPLAVMAISDRLVEAGGYDWRLMLTVYVLLTLPVALRGLTRRYFSLERGDVSKACVSSVGLIGCSLLCSLIFFLGTNVAVWLTSSWYPPTLAGLQQCLTNAVPFFRYTLAGDALFATMCFGVYAAVKLSLPASEKQVSTASA